MGSGLHGDGLAQEIKLGTAGVEPDAGPLDAVLDATERQFSDAAVLHVYANLDAYERMAKGIAAAGMTHHKRSADVIVIAIAAKELGLPLMQALRGMYVVAGKLACETWLMETLAMRLGVTKEVVEATKSRSTIVLRRDGHGDVESSFSLDDAVRAELILSWSLAGAGQVVVKPAPRRGIWKKHPEEMCYWRALSKGLRRIAPDMFGGMYTTDEARGFDRAATARQGDVSDLSAMLGAVEPDPDTMTEDEIDAMTTELRAALKRGTITVGELEETVGLAIGGDFSTARSQWAELQGRDAPKGDT